MTLDEAIKHAEEVAERKRKQVENGGWEKGSPTERDCIECAEEHRQLAELLKELKAYKENTCGDAISRQAVIDSLHSKFVDGFDSDRWWNSISVLHVINSAPPVTPKQRTGRWIDDEFGSKCSCCGIYTHLDRFDMPIKSKCCSMCGAKMEVEE